MLINSQAHISDGNQHPLLIILKSGRSCRECLAALIQGQEDEILKPIANHSLLYYALQENSTLIPVIASISKHQYEKHLKNNDLGDLYSFPPSDIEKSSDKKKIAEAIKLNDVYLPFRGVTHEVDSIVSPWEHTMEFAEYHPPQEIAESLMPNFESNSETDNYSNYSSTRKAISNQEEAIDIDDNKPNSLTQTQADQSANPRKLMEGINAYNNMWIPKSESTRYSEKYNGISAEYLPNEEDEVENNGEYYEDYEEVSN